MSVLAAKTVVHASTALFSESFRTLHGSHRKVDQAMASLVCDILTPHLFTVGTAGITRDLAPHLYFD